MAEYSNKIFRAKAGIPVAYNTSVFNAEGLNLDELFLSRDKDVNKLFTLINKTIASIQKKIDNLTPDIPDDVLRSKSLQIVNYPDSKDFSLLGYNEHLEDWDYQTSINWDSTLGMWYLGSYTIATTNLIPANVGWSIGTGSNSIYSAGTTKTNTKGNRSKNFGYITLTTNENEVALGKYNLSTPGLTLFSIGNGTSNSVRLNIFEIYTRGLLGLVRLGALELDSDLDCISCLYNDGEAILIKFEYSNGIPYIELFSSETGLTILRGIDDPINESDAANKAYVDSHSANIEYATETEIDDIFTE